MADAHELLGPPVLPNGIALSKIHHAAFERGSGTATDRQARRRLAT